MSPRRRFFHLRAARAAGFYRLRVGRVVFSATRKGRLRRFSIFTHRSERMIRLEVYR